MGRAFSLSTALVTIAALSGCQPKQTTAEPAVEFTSLPPAGEGSPDRLHPIRGRVKHALPGQQVVLYARSGVWWVQPTMAEPFTRIDAQSNWSSATHPGNAYAALLVKPEFHPPTTLKELPEKGGGIVAVAVAEGEMLTRQGVKTLHFSGYAWELRQVASDRGGTRNIYDPANAWTDKDGFLHLRIARQSDHWTSAEVNLTHSLGYGSYRFVVREVSHLEPAAVFSIFTWDESGPPREMDIEFSRWGEPASKNAQFVIQPYYVPANAVRFASPPGVLTHTLHWEAGRVSFQTARGRALPNAPSDVVYRHAFTSGVPSPGSETIHMNLYVFDNKTSPLRNECEVIIEKFEYLP